MKREKLSLEHQKILNERLRDITVPLSEYCFSNLYLFRDVHDYHVITADDIYIQGTTYDGVRFLMPTRHPSKINLAGMAEQLSSVDCLFPIPEEWLLLFNEKGYVHNFSEGDSDYIYSKEKLSSYSGKKLHSKKNLLNQFMRKYDAEVVPISAENIPDAVYILDTWQDQLGQPPENTDYHACREGLELFDRLFLCGVIYYVEGKPAGFLMGEGITGDTFAIHFAKALTLYKGIYQYMYNHCAKALPDPFQYFNFEQDLGIQALRDAKKSYIPDITRNKYRLCAGGSSS